MPPPPPSQRNALAGLEALDARSDPQRPVVIRPARGSKMQAIRTLGPFASLLLPLVLGGLAFALLRSSESGSTGIVGFGLALLAAPLMPALGIPFATGGARILLAAAASAILWIVIGALAAARATRDPSAGWGRFWGEWLWMAVCAWLGMLVGLAAAGLLLMA